MGLQRGSTSNLGLGAWVGLGFGWLGQRHGQDGFAMLVNGVGQRHGPITLSFG